MWLGWGPREHTGHQAPGPWARNQLPWFLTASLQEPVSRAGRGQIRKGLEGLPRLERARVQGGGEAVKPDWMVT